MQQKERHTGVHLAERLEHETDLFTAREEDEDFGLEVGFDEGPEDVEFAVEEGLDVVLGEGGGDGGEGGVVEADGDGVGEAEAG